MLLTVVFGIDVERTLGDDFFFCEMNILQRGAQLFMPEELLQLKESSSDFEKMCGKRVAQRMDTAAFGDPAFSLGKGKSVLTSPCGQRLVTLFTRKKKLLGTVGAVVFFEQRESSL